MDKILKLKKTKATLLFIGYGVFCYLFGVLVGYLIWVV